MHRITPLIIALCAAPLACESTLAAGTYDVTPGVGATDCTNGNATPPASVWVVTQSNFSYSAVADGQFTLKGDETEDENSLPVINFAATGNQTVNGCAYSHNISAQVYPTTPGADAFTGYYEDDVFDCNNQPCSERYPISGNRRH